MSIPVDGATGGRRQAVHGWLVSILVHGTVGAGIVLSMSSMFEIPEPEPFRLDISLVELPPDPVPHPQPVQQTSVTKPVLDRQPIQQKPIQQKPVKQVKQKEQVVQKTPVKHELVREQRRVPEPVKQTVVETVKAVPTPVPQPREVTTTPVEQNVAPTPVTQTEVARIQPQVQPQATVQPESTRRSVSTVRVPVTTPQRQSKSRPEVQSVQAVSRNGAKPTSKVVQSRSPSVKPVSAIVSGSVSRVLPKPVSRPPTPEQTKAPPVKSVSRRSVQRTVIKKKQTEVVKRELEKTPLPNADYGWVADTLLKRVQQLKRYPSRARRKVWEGTVELRVLINAAGEIQDVQVLESSGHNLLDEEALNTIKMASPLTLQHRIQHPIVMVDLPIVYKLN